VVCANTTTPSFFPAGCVGVTLVLRRGWTAVVADGLKKKKKKGFGFQKRKNGMTQPGENF